MASRSSSTRTSIVEEYVAAWNERDADAIIEAFAEGGRYTDPTVPEGLAAEAVGEYAADLWTAFPDLSFDVERLATTDDDSVLLQWRMHGTHEGPLDDLPPTGETVDVPGMDVIEVSDDGITSVRGYFDSGTMMRQLGMRVDVQPRQLGPFNFGVSTRLDLGKRTEPGAFSLTSITYRDAGDAEVVTGRSREIAQEMTEIDGFISAVFARDGERGYTITAWEDPEDTRQLMQGGTHKTAAGELLARDGLGAGGMTSVWTLDRMNGRFVRCTDCQRMIREADADGDATCPSCDAPLPELPAYW